MKKKTAIVTGITGQDGPYLAKFLLEKDYKVYGLCKTHSSPNLENLLYLGIENGVELAVGDVTNERDINHLIKATKPDVSFITLPDKALFRMIQRLPIVIHVTQSGGTIRRLK